MGPKTVLAGFRVFTGCVAMDCSVSWLGVFWVGLPGQVLGGGGGKEAMSESCCSSWDCDVCQQAGVYSWVCSLAVACECRWSVCHVVLAAPVACLTVAWLPLVSADIHQLESPRCGARHSSRAGPKEWGWGRWTDPSIRHPTLSLPE